MDEFATTWLQPLFAWRDFFLATASCASCTRPSRRHARPTHRDEDVSSSEQTYGQRCRDMCLPAYLPTSITLLEQERQRMALALFGQLAVVSFRVLAGHFGGGAIGMIVFVAGNCARCWLQSNNLTGFAILGFSAGAFDTVDLLQQLINLGPGLLALHLGAPVTQELDAISKVLAPVTEFMGAYIAQRCFVTPDMLFESHMASNAAGTLSAAPQRANRRRRANKQSSKSPNLVLSMPQIDAGHGGCAVQSRKQGSCAAQGRKQKERRSREQCMELGLKACDQCGVGVAVDQLRNGRGSFVGEAYCCACWRAWSSRLDGKRASPDSRPGAR